MRGIRLAVAALAAMVLSVVGCRKPPPVVAPAPAPITIVAAPEAKTKTSMTLTATADINPNDARRPSPIVVRVYQLRTDAAFTSASFRALYDDEKATLGAELITRDEYELGPNERREVEVTLATDTRFVGAIAAFWNTDAEWRALTAVPRGAFAIAVERARIVVMPVGAGD